MPPSRVRRSWLTITMKSSREDIPWSARVRSSLSRRSVSLRSCASRLTSASCRRARAAVALASASLRSDASVASSPARCCSRSSAAFSSRPSETSFSSWRSRASLSTESALSRAFAIRSSPASPSAPSVPARWESVWRRSMRRLSSVERRSPGFRSESVIADRGYTRTPPGAQRAGTGGAIGLNSNLCAFDRLRPRTKVLDSRFLDHVDHFGGRLELCRRHAWGASMTDERGRVSIREVCDRIGAMDPSIPPGDQLDELVRALELIDAGDAEDRAQAFVDANRRLADLEEVL